MNLNRAVQILSSPVTGALEYLGKYPSHAKGDFPNSRATVTFMKMMNLFFKIHDVSDRLQHIRQLDETHAPFVDIGDDRLEWLQNTFQEYIDSIQRESKKNYKRGLTKETAHALKFTAYSTAKCVSPVRMKCGSQDAADA
ncbi:hypothetical protein CBL_05081 [Carabus blaptoides fortunei]